MKTLHVIFTTMIKVIEVTPPKWETDLFSLDSLQKETFQLSYSQIRVRFQFNVCDGIQVSYYDWWATVVIWLFNHFSLDFLVLPVKKSDMSVKYKRQLNLTHHKQRATKLTCLVVHRDSHLIYRRYTVQKILFQWPSKVHKYQCTQNTHCFCIFFLFFSFSHKTHIFFCFIGHPRYTCINVHKTRTFFLFFLWFHTWQCLFLFI